MGREKNWQDQNQDQTQPKDSIPFPLASPANQTHPPPPCGLRSETCTKCLQLPCLAFLPVFPLYVCVCRCCVCVLPPPSITQTHLAALPRRLSAIVVCGLCMCMWLLAFVLHVCACACVCPCAPAHGPLMYAAGLSSIASYACCPSPDVVLFRLLMHPSSASAPSPMCPSRAVCISLPGRLVDWVPISLPVCLRPRVRGVSSGLADLALACRRGWPWDGCMDGRCVVLCALLHMRGRFRGPRGGWAAGVGDGWAGLVHGRR